MTSYGLSAPIQTISIERDYRECITKFCRDFPNELNGKVSQSEFEHTIDKINSWLEKAETIDFRNVYEECIGCLTFFTAYLWYKDKYSDCVEKISRFLQEQNDTVYYNKGISWVNPMNNGFLKIDIIIQSGNNQTLSPFSSTSLSSPTSSSVNTQPTINLNSSPNQSTQNSDNLNIVTNSATSPTISNNEISEQSSAITTNQTTTAGNQDAIININNNDISDDSDSDTDLSF